MSYTKEIIAAANQILADRRAEAEAVYSVRHLKVITEIPNIPQYEAQLAGTGADIVKAIAMGEDAEKYINELSEVNLRIQDLIKAELKSHGYPEDYLKVPYTCKKCDDTGYVGGYICDCHSQLLEELNRQASLEALRKVSPAQQCNFNNFALRYYSEEINPTFGVSNREIMGDILEYCKHYAEDFNPKSNSILLSGATGLGKTHLSLAIANVVAEKGYNVVYGSAQNLFTELEREKFSSNSSGEAEAKMLGCDLLIIDDLGSEFCTQFTIAELYNIINTRLNLLKPIIISTNLTNKEIEQKYTQRVLSRIIGAYTPLSFVGNDVRQIKSKED